MTVSRTAMTVVLLTLALVGGKFGCRAQAQKIRAEKLRSIQEKLTGRLSLVSPQARAELLNQLDAAIAQNATKDLSPIAIDTLRQRCEAILADGKIFPREAQHLIRLLNDFPDWQDQIHAIKYMGQR